MLRFGDWLWGGLLFGKLIQTEERERCHGHAFSDSNTAAEKQAALGLCSKGLAWKLAFYSVHLGRKA